MLYAIICEDHVGSLIVAEFPSLEEARLWADAIPIKKPVCIKMSLSNHLNRCYLNDRRNY